MKNISNNIKKLGFDKWFQNNVDPASLDSFEIARVIAVHKDSYR
jgi:ribosome biogenesis GTPase